jgi:hypothetical protein
VLYSARLVDEQQSAETPEAREHAGMLLDFLTPVAKSWPSQWCVEANSLAIQVHGGYGYTREYNVEQFYRDNRLNAIHEGTHGIHGLDLLGRKVSTQDGALFKAFGAELRKTVRKVRGSVGARDTQPAEAGSGQRRVAGPRRCAGCRWQRMEQVTQKLYAVGDMNKTLANASTYLEAVGHVVVAWIWLQQALVAAARLAGARCMISIAASCRPAATSSAGNCRRCSRSSTCWPASTPPRSTCRMRGFNKDGNAQAHRDVEVEGTRRGRPTAPPTPQMKRMLDGAPASCPAS